MELLLGMGTMGISFQPPLDLISPSENGMGPFTEEPRGSPTGGDGGHSVVESSVLWSCPPPVPRGCEMGLVGVLS